MKHHKLVVVSVTLLLNIFAAVTTAAQGASASEALALDQQGKFADAVEAWRAVTLQNPKDAGAFASLGVDLARLEKYVEAAQAYRRALSLDPKLPGIQVNLGLAEFKQGHFDAAIVPFSKALREDPQNSQARTLLGMSYYGARRFANAAKLLRLATDAEAGDLVDGIARRVGGRLRVEP